MKMQNELGTAKGIYYPISLIYCHRSALNSGYIEDGSLDGRYICFLKPNK